MKKKSQREISKLTKVSLCAVQSAIKRFAETNSQTKNIETGRIFVSTDARIENSMIRMNSEESQNNNCARCNFFGGHWKTD